MSGDGGDVFDRFPTTRRGNVIFDPKLVEETSGHKLLCKTCKTFRRTKIGIVHREDGRDVLRLMCKTCETCTDYVARGDLGVVPEAWAKVVRRYAFKQARTILKEAEK